MCQSCVASIDATLSQESYPALDYIICLLLPTAACLQHVVQPIYNLREQQCTGQEVSVRVRGLAGPACVYDLCQTQSNRFMLNHPPLPPGMSWQPPSSSSPGRSRTRWVCWPTSWETPSWRCGWQGCWKGPEALWLPISSHRCGKQGGVTGGLLPT